MKKVIASLIAFSLLTPLASSAHPGPGYGHGPGPEWRHDYRGGHHGGPGSLRFLPDAATAVLIGGLTYYLLNDAWYQRQGDTYVVVQPPVGDQVESNTMRTLDYNGQRYYVQGRHYYKRDISGEYVEIPRPSGL